MGGPVISEVELPGEGDRHFLGCRIDRPVVDSSAEENLLEIAGWVVAREGEPVSIEICDREFRLRTAPIARTREDVAELFADRPSALTSGFGTTLGTVGLPHDFELVVHVNFADGRRIQLAVIRGRREPMTPSYVPRIPPIMVTGLGRSGTTLLMHVLAACPEVVVGGGYPYELRFARYWLHVAKVLSDPADPNDAPPVDGFQHDLTSAPNNPFFGSHVDPAAVRWLAEHQPSLAGEIAQRSLDGVYGKLAAEQGGAWYFAEKFSPSYSQSIAWELYRERAREIFLVRDFRDVLSSIIAFNRKRGFEAFGRGESDDDLDFVRRLGGSARMLVQEWEERRDRAHLVRYEDLIGDPETTLESIGRYLGLDPRATEAMAAATGESSTKLDRHRTSADPVASMGRWRDDLTPEIIAACEESFASPLEAFGYLEQPA